MTVLWMRNAIENIDSIFEYYYYGVNAELAQKIKDAIIKRTFQLESNPKLGQKEKLLLNRRSEYRYLVEGNYKIIYWIDREFIKIAFVFDTRQNPAKITGI